MSGSPPLGAVVLAAGLGTRMRSARAKVLHELAGRPLLHYPLAALRRVGVAKTIVVVGYQADAVHAAARSAGLPGTDTVLQVEQQGTGHAVRCAAPAFAGFPGDVLVLYGDVPFIRPASLRRLVDAHRAADATLSLLTVRFADPTGYGRIVRDDAGRVTGIVEERDASPGQKAITEINPGFYCLRASRLGLLDRLKNDNAQHEFYLTDLVGIVAAAGERVETVLLDDPAEVTGVNTRAELARMEATLRRELVAKWMAEGVTFEDPETAYVGPDVTIGRDTVVGPNVTLRGTTRLGEGCRLDGTIHLVDTAVGRGVHVRFASTAEGAEIGDEAVIGPFARLRPGTKLAERVHVGNFVETKQATLGAGTKANHLTYLGDCEVGPDSNVGAGTITCNYDGFKKYKTTIGARVFVGSDTTLVAPVTLADDVYVGAGTTVTRNVPAGALLVTRAPDRLVEDWTARKRARMRGEPVPVRPRSAAAAEVRKPPKARAAKKAARRKR